MAKNKAKKPQSTKSKKPKPNKSKKPQANKAKPSQANQTKNPQQNNKKPQLPPNHDRANGRVGGTAMGGGGQAGGSNGNHRGVNGGGRVRGPNGERLLLQPLKFVGAVQTATLFQRAEELLEPTFQDLESFPPLTRKVSEGSNDQSLRWGTFCRTQPPRFNNLSFNIGEEVERITSEVSKSPWKCAPDTAPTTPAIPVFQKGSPAATNRRPTPRLRRAPDHTLGITPTEPETPQRTVDMAFVEPQVRLFLADKDKKTVTLPVCDAETREKTLLLAALFRLESKTESSTLGWSVTLSKAKKSGKNVDEQEVGKLMREFRQPTLYDASDDVGKKEKGKEKEKGASKRPKLKEGDVVGHAAPKIDKTNIGFLMLALMGWSGSATIGLSGGLDAPLPAIVKRTKLGLGASGPSAKPDPNLPQRPLVR